MCRDVVGGDLTCRVIVGGDLICGDVVGGAAKCEVAIEDEAKKEISLKCGETEAVWRGREMQSSHRIELMVYLPQFMRLSLRDCHSSLSSLVYSPQLNWTVRKVVYVVVMMMEYVLHVHNDDL